MNTFYFTKLLKKYILDNIENENLDPKYQNNINN